MSKHLLLGGSGPHSDPLIYKMLPNLSLKGVAVQPPVQCQTPANRTAPRSLLRAEVPSFRALAANRIWEFAAP